MRAEWRVEPDVDWRPLAELRRRYSRTGWRRRVHLAFWALLWALTPWNVLLAIVAVFVTPRPRWREEGIAADDGTVRLLSEQISGVPEFVVDMALFRDGVFCGQDRGILRFVNGWMSFQGVRTEWSLSSDDAEVVGAATLPVRSLGLDFRTKAICLKHETAQSEIALILRDVGRFTDFTAILWHWNDEPPPVGEEVLPPLELHPQVLYQILVWEMRSIGVAVRAALAAVGFVFAMVQWAQSVPLSLVTSIPVAFFSAIIVLTAVIWPTVREVHQAIAYTEAAIRVWGLAQPTKPHNAIQEKQQIIASTNARKRV